MSNNQFIGGRSCPIEWVGDPVNVVTGANVDEQNEFVIDGAVPFEWTRHYSSGLHRQRRSLGWGHAHAYDWELIQDVDGYRMIMPSGQMIAFPPLPAEYWAQADSQGWVLTRRSDVEFRVDYGTNPTAWFRFSPTGKRARLAELERAGKRLKLQYGDGDVLQEIKSSDGRRFVFERDAKGQLESLILHAEGQPRRLFSFRFDAAGNWVEGVDLYHNKFSFEWDSENRLVRKTDRRGYSFSYRYDDKGRCVSCAGEDGLHKVQLRYLERERVTVVTKHNGGEWTYFYDENGTITLIVDPLGGKRTFELDDQGRVRLEVDPVGNEYRYAYSETGECLGKWGPKGQFERKGAQIQPPNRGVRFTPLAQGLPTPLVTFRVRAPRTRVVPNARSTAIEWDYGSEFRYSTFRRPRPESAMLGEFPPEVRAAIQTQTEAIAEDVVPGVFLAGRTYPPGRSTRDSIGNLASHIDPDGGKQTWRYDANGNVSRYTDRDDHSWNYEYASWNVLSAEILPDRRVVRYGHTLSEHLAHLETRSRRFYDHDLNDRLAAIRLEQAGLTTFAYDLAGNAIERRDRAGSTIQLSYVAGDVARVDAKDVTIEFERDAEGHITQARRGDVVVDREYSQYGMCTAERCGPWTLEHECRAIVRTRSTLLGRFSIHYREDSNGDDVVVDPTGKEHRIHRSGGGVLTRSFGNGRKELSQYDWEGKCLARVVYGGGPAVAPWARVFRYSADGNLLRVEDEVRGHELCTYDDAGRLVSVDRGPGSLEEFRYDTANNLVHMPGIGPILVDDQDRVVAGPRGVRYDARGFLVERLGPTSAVVYDHDVLGDLRRCELSPGEWSAEYDGFSRRISKSCRGRRTDFIWDGERLAAERDGDGRFRIYLYAHHDSLVPMLFVEYESIDADPASGRRYYVFADQVGAPVCVEDDRGDPVWEAVVHPYGQTDVVREPRTDFLNLRWPGHYWDSETGLHYNRFRYYNPELGRYLEPDPLDIERTTNVYAYTPRPLSEVDVDGLGCKPKAMLLDESCDPDQRKAAKKLAADLKDFLDHSEKGRDSDGNPIMRSRDETYAVAVVRVNGKAEIWVTKNRGGEPPEAIRPMLDAAGAKWVRGPRAEGEGSPKVPRRDAGTPTKQNDAEQRLLRAVDCDPNAQGVESITPTRPCCNQPHGCTQEIQSRNDPNLQSVEPIDGLSKSQKPTGF